MLWQLINGSISGFRVYLDWRISRLKLPFNKITAPWVIQHLHQTFLSYKVKCAGLSSCAELISLQEIDASEEFFFYTSSCKHNKHLDGHKHYGWPTTHNVQRKNRTHTASCGLCATHAKYSQKLLDSAALITNKKQPTYACLHSQRRQHFVWTWAGPKGNISLHLKLFMAHGNKSHRCSLAWFKIVTHKHRSI